MIWHRSPPPLSLRAYLVEEDGGLLGAIGLGTTAASLLLKPKLPKPPTPPSPSQDIVRPSAAFFAPSQGSFNGTYFGGGGSGGSGTSASGGAPSASPASPSGGKFLGA